MIENKHHKSTSKTSEKFAAQAAEEKIDFYQIEELHREIDYLKRRLALIPEPLQWLCKHLQQFWWTISSLVGLGWLHNGARQIEQNTATSPTISLPTVSLDEMPTPRLFLDVTVTYKSKLNTGVQRVIRELCQYGEIGGELAPVIIDQGVFVNVTDLKPLNYQKGDKVILLDSGWTHTKIYVPALENAKSGGAEIILGIYDLIPIQHPGFVHPYFTSLFEEWLQTITPYCTAVIAISRYSAECFVAWAKKNPTFGKTPPVGWFYLGANLSENTLKNHDFFQNNKIPSNFWLSVGTLEPRKGYSVTLDAFDRLWLDNVDVSYVIIGRKGDLSSHISERILNHSLFGKKLFWPQDVDDRLLNEYYKKARGVIIPALAEGFGLPLIEAHFHGKQIVASDLPVFREIAPVGVNFFPLSDAKTLSDIIRNSPDHESMPLPENYLDWKTATEKMIAIIKTDYYQMRPE